MRAFQRGLRGWLAGELDEDAIAAGCNVAEVLVMLREVMVKKEN